MGYDSAAMRAHRIRAKRNREPPFVGREGKGRARHVLRKTRNDLAQVDFADKLGRRSAHQLGSEHRDQNGDQGCSALHGCFFSSTLENGREGRSHHAREALAQDNLYRCIAALSRRVPRSEKAMSPEGSVGSR